MAYYYRKQEEMKVICSCIVYDTAKVIVKQNGCIFNLIGTPAIAPQFFWILLLFSPFMVAYKVDLSGFRLWIEYLRSDAFHRFWNRRARGPYFHNVMAYRVALSPSTFPPPTFQVLPASPMVSRNFERYYCMHLTRFLLARAACTVTMQWLLTPSKHSSALFKRFYYFDRFDS